MTTENKTELKRILLASGNPKKQREFQLLLAPLGIEIVDPSSVGGLADVDEDRPTFAGNAIKKAQAAAASTGMIALADDSGLEVDALGGAPGVRSARFAGEPCDDDRNNEKLLAELEGVAGEHRGARFVCALALVNSDGTVIAAVEGSVRGQILFERRGDRDFGYDPLFEFAEPGLAVTGRSFAELTTDEKASVSHRGRAVRQLASVLFDSPPTDNAPHV